MSPLQRGITRQRVEDKRISKWIESSANKLFEKDNTKIRVIDTPRVAYTIYNSSVAYYKDKDITKLIELKYKELKQ